MGQNQDPDGDVQMTDLGVETQFQESLKSAQDKIIGSLSGSFQNLFDENKKLQNQLTELKDELKRLKSSSPESLCNVEGELWNIKDFITAKLNESFENQKKEFYKQMDLFKEELKDQNSAPLNELKHVIESEFQNIKDKLNPSVSKQDKGTELDQLRKENMELRQLNNKLKDENSNYQVTIGNATRYRFADDDQNNSVHLNKDINDLNDRVSKFVTNLKKDVKLHSDKVSELFLRYKCTKDTKEEGPQLEKEVLRRFVIDTIIQVFNESLNSENSYFEKEVMNDLKSLLNKLNSLTNTESGSNDIKKSIIIKIRQQIYAILGSSAFTEPEHPFINNCKTQLINTMNQYRTITNESKRKEIEGHASALVRDVISIFYFRRHVQEPIVNYTWIDNDEPIDSLTMTGTCAWNEDEIDELVVQLCSFPLFGIKLEDHDKRQFYTQARVIAKEGKSLPPEKLRQRAHGYMRSGKYDRSLSIVNKLLEVEPNDTLALKLRGEIHYR
ncbi:17492_t:CDS:2 [Cetraspora pellucida]|uniref:17492_t:CDS:1 n=1 Tax=Cetraspora pellucida TaxID=1433469 RepID=A0A9N9IBD8_9GLOM|nr:17492_t:CDS:2 [Cetraspora pellucida]